MGVYPGLHSYGFVCLDTGPGSSGEVRARGAGEDSRVLGIDCVIMRSPPCDTDSAPSYNPAYGIIIHCINKLYQD